MKNNDWSDLFEYVKVEVLKYTDKKLPKYVVLRLQGLKDGKFIGNKKTKSQGEYDYKTILLTFKLCKKKIDDYIGRTEFANEQHMMNGIFIIVESEINNVKDRLKNAKKSEEILSTKDLSHQATEQSTYTRQDKKVNTKLKHLW